MLQSFDQWRKAHEARFADITTMHYHRVDTVLWLDFSRYLLDMQRQRPYAGKALTVRFPLAFFDQLDAFLDQMRFAYIHPRSTSARYDFAKANRTANPSML